MLLTALPGLLLKFLRIFLFDGLDVPELPCRFDETYVLLAFLAILIHDLPEFFVWGTSIDNVT